MGMVRIKKKLYTCRVFVPAQFIFKKSSTITDHITPTHLHVRGNYSICSFMGSFRISENLSAALLRFLPFLSIFKT